MSGQGPVKQSEKPMETHVEVTAVEDLMREHGVLRRILVVYSETAEILKEKPPPEIYGAIHRAAKLFDDFGVRHHEKALEEAIIFPALANGDTEAARYIKPLIGQHTQAHRIAEFILSETQQPEPHGWALVPVMEALVRMYRTHAAREDTIVFPAWKETQSKAQLDEMAERFEKIEQEQFGEGGFEKAVSEVAAIEEQLGVADLRHFTARHWR